MPHEYFCGGWMWIFPVTAMIVCFAVMLVMVFGIFGRGFRAPWQGSGRYRDESLGKESALDFLKKRYAKGEISRDEFEQMKKDILN